MAKSLADIVRKSKPAATTQVQEYPGPEFFPEYVGSDTDELYVVGYKGNSHVKIKVRSNSCCDGIDLDGSSTPGGGTIVYDGLKAGATFKSLDELSNQLDVLEEKTIYSVKDKGTLEQYIIDKGALLQISGNTNVIVNDPGLYDPSVCPVDTTSGIVNYSLSELTNGDFFFKNHTELHTFIGDIPYLTSGKEMFWNTSLTTFRGELSNLTEGYGMFGKGCKLDYDSILYIVDSLSSVSSAKIHIGYDSTQLSDAEKDAFTAELEEKGWTVTWYCDGII